MADKLGIIIVAAGRGSRMGTKESKQYLLLDGKPIIVHTLERFEKMSAVEEIVLVTGREDVQRCRDYANQYGLTKCKHIIPGGKERQDSVYQGLLALGRSTEWVMVHDGVRPFAHPDHVLACLQRVQEMGAAVLAVPVKDTIKVVGSNGTIQSTPDRSSLWAIQTPQAFRFALLLDAHEKARQEGFMGTDDAMLVEWLGHPVDVVPSDYYNIKITTPEDLPWAEWILRHARGEVSE
ncbi:2-C-methyl-D-erythritol 4-phosphate cytidylyltransferase [Paenibacillus mucilaginosus 3016]|uniref:2-C-methyl-D-erythritol 4-phosphate cytidylyltransferase n=1 Tax=Paenibacillus mucilaginosus 3016 TaxID=1116391 RepID=H6NSC4_9BACL|nr:2-C-methyl-D-erythritol 4-phosphate cytidylyltransferase [Paenibacillus mucilaginosus]AFC33674.1 2-C-methyl-D-erythritol 4-phosphate cytidylyltransferase [Paenibacillus mucilaginosus 3016]WFA22078.1 2-C-methyl-D-erythritol 4-phosphate cytidylyltransferase [Paenibacillus mucilaginosus]